MSIVMNCLIAFALFVAGAALTMMMVVIKETRDQKKAKREQKDQELLGLLNEILNEIDKK